DRLHPRGRQECGSGHERCGAADLQRRRIAARQLVLRGCGPGVARLDGDPLLRHRYAGHDLLQRRRRDPESDSSRGANDSVVALLYTLAVILLIAWLLGVVGTYTIGAFVHVLLVIAIVLFIVGLLSGRRT